MLCAFLKTTQIVMLSRIRRDQHLLLKQEIPKHTSTLLSVKVRNDVKQVWNNVTSVFKDVLIIIFIVLFFSSCTFEKMFYYPNKVLSHQNKADSLGFELVNFPSKNGKVIYGYFAIPKAPILGAILLLHGNAGNISDNINSIETLQNAGFEVLAIDYQGFGISQGEVSHQNLVDDAESALTYLEEKINKKNIPIIVLGRSIGGHLAVKIAYAHQSEIKAMVVEGAFTSHHDIAVAASPFWLQPFATLLVKSDYKASKLIKEVKIPKLIIHSTEDEVIPYWMGVELYNKAPEPKEFWEIKGCHICGMWLYSDEYIKRLKKLVAN